MAIETNQRYKNAIKFSWFNSLKEAGQALEDAFGSGFIPETTMTLENDTAATDVTSGSTAASVDKEDYRSAEFEYHLYRKTDTALSEVREKGTILLEYMLEDGAWVIAHHEKKLSFPDGSSKISSGVTLTVSETDGVATVRVATDDLPGDNYTAKLNFKMRTFNA